MNIYGTKDSHTLRGNNENTDVGKFLRDYLEVNVDKITEELVKASKSLGSTDTNDNLGWTGKIPSEEDIATALGSRY